MNSVRFDDVTWVANLHLLFTEVPLLDRFAAARSAGFDNVEIWWPFDGRPVPSEAEIEGLISAVETSGVHLLAMNLYAGAMADGDRGVVSHPSQAAEFRASVDVGMRIGRRLGTRLFNVPYGRRLDALSSPDQSAAAANGLAYAARAAAELNGTILVEPLSGFADYPILTVPAAIEVIRNTRDAAGLANIGLLLDQYHLATNQRTVLEELVTGWEDLRHVQVAEVPDRSEPRSATGGVRDFVCALVDRGYSGAVGLEYRPSTSTTESLAVWREAFGIRR